jgi:uncharacterized cupin superfamily protein
MMIKRTREEIMALEGELLCDGGHRLTLIDGTVVDCVALELGRGVAHVFTSRGDRATYRYADILAARVLDDVKQLDALVEALMSAGLITD